MSTRRRSPLGLLLAAVVVTLGAWSASCAGASPAPSGDRSAAPTVSSNVLRADYAGSAACATCHADIARAFVRSPMHRMTRNVDETDVTAPFDGQAFEHQGDTVTLEQHEGRRYMRLHSQGREPRLFRITKVIGGRTREDFAGVLVRDTSANAPRLDDEERIMPVSYVVFDRAFRYKGYSVMVPERDRMEPGSAWTKTCLFCHNTAPHLVTVYDDLAETFGPLTEKDKYQGAVTDRLLPAARLWRYRVTDADALEREVEREVERMGFRAEGSDTNEVLRHAIGVTRRHFGEAELTELGIGCEACHGGARAHVDDPSLSPSFAPESALFEQIASEGARDTPAQRINHACARCHTVVFSEYAYTWEGAHRDDLVGGSHINSGEARDYLLGGCASEMSCVTCHDPHAGSSREALDRLGTVAGNPVCTTCHEAYRDPSALRAHAHHDPQGAGAACLACHMPKKNVGLEYRLTRYHRIGSPTEAARVERDRPLECALCHTERSARELVETMERWWGKSYDRGKLEALYRSLDESPITTTLTYGKPHEQATAAGTLGEHGSPADAPRLVGPLVHPYPLVRYYARAALTRLMGEAPPVDLFGPPRERQEAATKWLAERR